MKFAVPHFGLTAPATLSVFGLSLLAFGFVRRRKRA